MPVCAALGGALVYGATGVLQQRGTQLVPVRPGDRSGFVRGLLRQPLWLFSTIGSAGGFVLQGVALSTGPLVLVQPLLVTSVLFAALTGFLLRRGPVDWPLVGGLLMTSGGLALFLVAARPTAGGDLLALGQVIPLAAGLAVVIAGCLALAVRGSSVRRALALALAAGIVYGVTAAVAKVMLSRFSLGPAAVLADWSLWALAVLGPTGFLLNQYAFRAAPVASPVVAVITVTDPLVGIAIGLLWLGESVNSGGLATAAEVVGLGVMAAGVWTVARRAPHLSGAAGEGEARRPGRGAVPS